MRFWCQLGSLFIPKNFQNRVLEAPWAVLGPSWASWNDLWASRGLLRPSWRPSGAVSRPSWSVLGPSGSPRRRCQGGGARRYKGVRGAGPRAWDLPYEPWKIFRLRGGDSTKLGRRGLAKYQMMFTCKGCVIQIFLREVSERSLMTPPGRGQKARP